MAVKSQSVDDIVSKFPIKTIPRIDGEPTYESINEIMQMLYANAATLPTTTGGGTHGHIGLIMKPALYSTLSEIPYTVPVDPGPLPIYEPGSSGLARQQITNEFEESKRIFENHYNMDLALKALIIEAVEAVYLEEKRDRYTGFLTVTARDLMTHLLQRYGKITASDLMANKRRMDEPLDPSVPIDVYFQRIDECVQFATDAETAYTPQQILQTAYYGISLSNLYTDACKEWRRKPQAEKTWTNFKTFFASEYHELKEQEKTTAMGQGYHSANVVRQNADDDALIVESLQHLALAATTDKQTIAQLVESNAKLTENIGKLSEKLTQALQTIATLSGSANTSSSAPKPKTTNQLKFDLQMDPVGYCWSHGYKVKLGHSSATCTRKKPGHQDTATRADIMGGSTTNKNWVHPHCVIVPPNHSHNANNADSSDYMFNSCANHYAILDSGATDHYLHKNPNPSHVSQAGYNPVTVSLPNGNTLTSTQKCTLPLCAMNAQATSGHVIPNLNKSLLSIGKFCDANYTAVFTNKDVKICKSPIQIPEHEILLTGHRNAKNGLYVTDFHNISTAHSANKVDHMQNATTKNSITFLYLAAFSPAISTLTQAIQKGFFHSWPGFTVNAIKKYVSDMPHVSAGRMDHVRKNIRSTKLTQIHNTISHDLRPTQDKRNTHNPPHTVDTQDYYVHIEHLQKIYTDQTGRFPITSSMGSKYCFILYSFDANAILVEPIKNRSASELLRAHNKLVQYLIQKGYKPNMHYLDNEAPQSIKSYDTNNKIKYQLVPPFSHRRNAAERAIRTWKNHFITGLCSVDPNFPMHLWDKLIPQSEITLNLLRPSRRNPNISAYEALNGKFNYDATPLAPPGCKVIAFESPQNRNTFAPHGVQAWYVGPTMEHYRCYKIYVPKTRAERICDTVSFHPYLCKSPVLQPIEQAVIAANKLTTALQNFEKQNAPHNTKENKTIQALETLSNIFLQRIKHKSNNNTTQSPRVMESTRNPGTPAPRVIQQTPAPTHRQIHVIPPDPTPAEPATIPRKHRYNTRLNVANHGAHAIIDADTGRSLEYRQLIRDPKHKEVWTTSMSNEIGRLAQGNNIVQGTNTMFFITYENIPNNRRKDITYAKIVVDYRPHKQEKERTRITVGGNLINYPDNVSTKTAEVTTAKILINSTISTPNAQFCVFDIGNFYLGTPMQRYEYMFIYIKDIPPDIVNQYNLNELAIDGKVYVEIRKGMYGLPQAGILANELLQKNLAKFGYHQCRHTPGLWRHKIRPIVFVLVVDDFGVKYVGKEHVMHLLNALKTFYNKISIDWEGKLFCGIKLQWDYKNKHVDLSMPGYIQHVLHKYHHNPSQRKQYAPYPYQQIIYGQKVQKPTAIDNTPALNDKDKKYVQQVIGALLYYARAIDCTMLVTLSKLSHMQAKPTQLTLQLIQHLLDYCATNPKATIRYKPSDMILKIHSDASYLSEPKARSRCGGHFYLGSKPVRKYTPNGAILNSTNVIQTVVTSAAEAEYVSLYINAKTGIPMRNTLIEMGHPQPPTPIQTDNTTAVGIANDSIKQKYSKALDMRWYWLKDQIKLKRYDVYFKPGSQNKADYFTKNHSPSHHRQSRFTFLHQANVAMQGCVENLYIHVCGVA